MRKHNACEKHRKHAINPSTFEKCRPVRSRRIQARCPVKKRIESLLNKPILAGCCVVKARKAIAQRPFILNLGLHIRFPQRLSAIENSDGINASFNVYGASFQIVTGAAC